MNRINLLYILFAVLLFSGCGGKRLRQIEPRTDRYSVDSLIMLARFDLDAAYQRVDEGQRSGELSDYESASLRANLTYQYTDNYPLAMEYCTQALACLGGEEDDALRVGMYYLMATAAEAGKDFSACIRACSQGKEIAHRHQMRFEEYSFDYLVGRCMFYLDQYEEGLALMHTAIDKAKRVVDARSDYGHLIFFVNNLISCYVSVEDMEHSLQESKVLEQLIDDMEKQYPSAEAYYVRSRYYLYNIRAVAKASLGRSVEAQADFYQSLSLDYAYTRDGMDRQIDYYAVVGNVDSIFSILARIPYQDEDTVKRVYRRRLSRLEQAYRVAGDTAMANGYQCRVEALSQLIDRREQEEGTAVHAAQYDTQQYRLALDDLAKSSKRIRILLCLLAVFILLTFIVLYHVNKRKMAKAAEELVQKTQSMEEEMERLQKQVRLIARDDSKASSEATKQAAQSLATFIEGQQLYLNKDISRSLIVQLMGCSQQTMTKMLNEIQPGLSFPDYIKGLRIAHALKLIKENPNLTVQQVADQSGFYSLSSLERSFKAVTGKTPRECLRDAATMNMG